MNASHWWTPKQLAPKAVSWKNVYVKKEDYYPHVDSLLYVHIASVNSKTYTMRGYDH